MLSLFQLLVNLKTAIESGAPVNEVWQAVVKVGDNLFGSHHPEMQSAPAGQDVAKLCDDIKTCCEARLANRGQSQAAPVGKLGDGTLLKIIIELLPSILDLFKK